MDAGFTRAGFARHAPAVVQEVIFGSSKMGSPAIFRFTGGKSGTAARYIVFFNGAWAIREHEWGLEGTALSL